MDVSHISIHMNLGVGLQYGAQISFREHLQSAPAAVAGQTHHDADSDGMVLLPNSVN